MRVSFGNFIENRIHVQSIFLERCPVNIVTRKVCQFCRYAKCIAIGMKPKWFVKLSLIQEYL